MATSDTLIDRVFDGRYRVVRKLGTGGMANVYLAEDQELGRRVAIKMLDDRHSQDDQFVERFRREAKNAAGLSHPNIVAIYDRGEAEGTYYIAMEYLEGRTLKELIVTRGPTPVPVAIDYTRQILAGLAFAHKNGIVHRDIKPHNIIVGPDGRVKVTDFGIARSGASQMTEAGSIIGTAQYLSPEQARGAPVDQRSDLYSVGIVLYEMLTGTVPFTGDTPLEIAMKHLSATPDPPSARRPEILRDLDYVILRALAKDPDDRYANAEEMDADLARVLRGAGVSEETAEAATAILSGTALAAAAPTQVVPRRPRAGPPVAPPAYSGPPTGFYEYDEPRRRPVWPWVLGILLAIAAGFAAFYVYTKIQDQLAANKPVRVENYVGLVERLAVAKIRASGFKAHIVRQPYDKPPIQVGQVFKQAPDAGSSTAKGNPVTIFVSTGKAKTTVPDVRNKSSADATAALTAAHLKYKIVEIHSTQPAGQVTAQDPQPGTKVVQGTVVRINVSKGIAPIAVPVVIGLPYQSALATLQGAGFAVAPPHYVDSSEAKGTVIGEDPKGDSLQPKGSTITLTVSKGPKTSSVPDVTSTDQATASQTLKDSGFIVVLRTQATNDPSLDGIVIDQRPTPGTQALPGTSVTIIVGHYKAPPPPPPTTAATTTTATTTPTATTDTTATTTTTPTTP